MLVSIVHLCVHSHWQGRGISRLLFDELKSLTKDGYLGVRVHCRVDYPANKLWPKLDFVAMGEIDGRGKKGTRLTIWKYEYDHPSLFSYASLQNENRKVKVVIDANVFYQLQAPDVPDHEESLPLLEPWLDIDLYITPEMLNEISRNKNKAEREAARKFADSFNTVATKASHLNFQKTQKELRPLFPESLSQSDASDLRQLAYAISDGIPFFVTRDGLVLDRADDIFEKFSIQILRPSDLILMQDELLRGEDYAPSRLAGSNIRIEKVHSQQSGMLIKSFLPDSGETKGSFNKKLQLALSNASTVETRVVLDAQGEAYGLISCSRQSDGQMDVPIFRVGKSAICRVVARYLINNLVMTASMENRKSIRISDEHLSPKVIPALQESGFFQFQEGWLKVGLQDTLDVNSTIALLSAPQWPDFSRDLLDKLTSLLHSASNSDVMLDIEKILWPLKITELDIPVYVVPIRPEWAMHLFDADIANQDLFGGEPALILNAENVYYRSSFPKVLSAPGRVLWYVSAANRHYQGSMCIKACSYIDEVEIGKPKPLFSKYKNLGIYKWGDVYNGVAGSELDKDIMAFKFSKTEIFKHPISLSKLQEIWKADGKIFNNAVSPLKISQGLFLSLYALGMKGH